MNYAQALDALNQGEPISNSDAINSGYLLLYQMVDKSIGKKIIVRHWRTGEKEVYVPTQDDVLSTSWRILKDTEL